MFVCVCVSMCRRQRMWGHEESITSFSYGSRCVFHYNVITFALRCNYLRPGISFITSYWYELCWSSFSLSFFFFSDAYTFSISPLTSLFTCLYSHLSYLLSQYTFKCQFSPGLHSYLFDVLIQSVWETDSELDHLGQDRNLSQYHYLLAVSMRANCLPFDECEYINEMGIMIISSPYLSSKHRVRAQEVFPIQFIHILFLRQYHFYP